MSFFDHHVHTGYSRCVKTPYAIKAALERALQRGYVEGIGITNHVHFNSPEQEHLVKSRAEIDALNRKLKAPRVLLGAEVDVDHPTGKFVLTKISQGLVDYVIAGPHNLPHQSLAMDGMDKEEFAEYFGTLEEIIVNSFSKNPVDIWVHPFLQEIEIGGEFFSEYIFAMLPRILTVLKECDIAMEISATFHRDKMDTVKIFKQGQHDEPWLQVIRITNKIYKAALDHGGINFSFGSDAHELEDAGDIGMPAAIAGLLGIPGSHILHITDLKLSR
nr:hypothetical protein [Candidatus Sigynarchaeota archaeon]